MRGINEESKRKAKVRKIHSTYSDFEERLEYNKNIGKLPESMKNIQVLGERGVIVAPYKFTEVTTEDGGVINPKYLQHTSEGGKPTFQLDDFVYQARGVVIYVSDKAKQYMEKELEKVIQPGDTVWLSSQAMSNTYQFIHNRRFPVVYAKYLRIHPSLIEAVEDTDKIKIEYTTTNTTENDK